MSTLELSQYIGKQGLLPYPDKILYSLVRVVDAKHAFGNLRFQVTPVSGTGLVWVDSNRVKFPTNTEERIEL